MSANDYYRSRPGPNQYPMQQQGGYFPQQPPNAYQGYNQQQYGGYPQGPGYGQQPMYAQQPQRPGRGNNSDGLMGCLAGLLCCCCAEEMCLDCCF
ncbi:CYSTM domain-containing protein [Mycena chlorophos]|uniref:Uncharacterized protein n=2 Tax=Mycena chlorophos TaxID=658473 RepID=A0ABQ0LWF2_MYCCL|nr:CYSTM domain-containing protein [Mycena chlorophos]GAT55416.1 predicted protein [Mycena chlorophos]